MLLNVCSPVLSLGGSDGGGVENLKFLKQNMKMTHYYVTALFPPEAILSRAGPPRISSANTLKTAIITLKLISFKV